MILLPPPWKLGELIRQILSGELGLMRITVCGEDCSMVQLGNGSSCLSMRNAGEKLSCDASLCHEAKTERSSKAWCLHHHLLVLSVLVVTQ